MTDHRCQFPSTYPMDGRQLPWECADCGRIWHPVYSGFSAWWEETRGPDISTSAHQGGDDDG